MGLTLFLTASLIELSLLLYTLKTSRTHRRVKSITRGIYMTLFLMLFLVGVFTWSSRYYLLFFLIFCIVLFDVLSYFSKQPLKPFKASRVIRRTTGMIFLLFCASFPLMLFPEFELLTPTGNYAVDQVVFTYTDTTRIETFRSDETYRYVNVEMWYPKDAMETYPLVVFSHGGIANNRSNHSLYLELASHGYVVASVDHTYHSLATTNTDGTTVRIHRPYMLELLSEDAQASPLKSFELYQKWMTLRTQDLDFVIDHIVSLSTTPSYHPVYELINVNKIGVMGHSLGGSAALCMGHIRSDIQAILALESPMMCDIIGVENNTFIFTDTLSLTPMLHVYSDSSWPHLAQWKQYGQNQRLLTESYDHVFNIHLSGMYHFGLTDLALTSPLLTRLLNGSSSAVSATDGLTQINQISLTFFDYFLKNDGDSPLRT